MNDTAVPTLALSYSVGCATATIAGFIYLLRVRPSAWVRWLAVAWIFWLARLLVALFGGGFAPLSNPITLLLPFGWIAGFNGAWHALGARHAWRNWFAAVAVLAALSIATSQGLVPTGWPRNAYFLLGAGTLLAGVPIVLTSPQTRGPTRWLIVASLLLQGVIAALYPLITSSPESASITVSLGVFSHVAMLIGATGCTRYAMLEEEEAAEQRQARALEYVVRGLVPMCAHCRSVRDQHGEWTSLEQFVAEHSGLESDEAVCPDCQAKATT